MTGRELRPFVVDEFAAVLLHELIRDEMDSLRVELHEYRDKGDGLSWARLKLTIESLHSVWWMLDWQLRGMGDPSSETLEWYMADVVRTAERMPRSKANAAVVQRRKELRARVAAARKAARAKRKG